MKKKRIFDIILSIILLIFFTPVIFICWIIAFLETGCNGFYTQVRLGQYQKKFRIVKIRTMKVNSNIKTNITVKNDTRITTFGKLFRRLKIDELPQLWNIFIGEMSFVGPRPDLPKYVKSLDNKSKKIIFSVKPGLTGPASLKYLREESFLQKIKVKNIEYYNDNVIYPNKVKININYIKNWTFSKDIYIIYMTILTILFKKKLDYVC